MNKFIKALLLSLLYTGFIYANPVTQKEAAYVAIEFYTYNAPNGFTNFNIKQSTESSYQSKVLYYTFEFEAGGFVLVSADDAVIPILGYSYENTIKNNPNTAYYLDLYNKNIHEIISSNLDNSETKKQWLNIKSARTKKALESVEPLLTTTWSQIDGYNTYSPLLTATGCVATAMAQIMNYHEFPVNGSSWHSYAHPIYGVQNAYFSTTEYQWDNMPNTSPTDDIAWLMYHCGVSVDMEFSTIESGAFSIDVPYALANYFKYDQAMEYVYASDYADEEWINLLKTNLDNALPIYYSGKSVSGGHAFVCDGYDSNDLFHFNWGWAGEGNGYFAIGHLNPLSSDYNSLNQAILNIKPSIENEEEFLWVRKYSDFPTESVLPKSISIVDDKVAWAVAQDGTTANTKFKTFTRTIDGGAIWNSSSVSEYGSDFSMIHGVSDSVAYIAVWGNGVDNHIIKTTDGGESWFSVLSGAGSGSYFNVVYFFDENHGVVLGDQVDGEYEIYTTSNAGVDWTRVAGENIPDPETTSEYGIENLYDAVGDTIWFTTNNGYVYKSTDKGVSWSKYQIESAAGKTYITIAFSDNAQRGLAIVYLNNEGPYNYQSDDGGKSWTILNATGNYYTSDVCAIPGTENSFVSAGANFNTNVMGVSHSYDGGLTWQDYAPYYQSQPFRSIEMYSETKGYAGTFTGTYYGGIWVLGGIGNSVIVDFEVDETDVCLNEELILKNTSIGQSDSMHWDFGEGAEPATGMGIGPFELTYSTPGSKTLSVVSYIEGEPFIEIKTDYLDVHIVPEANFTYEFYELDSMMVIFTDNSFNTEESTIYRWDFGDSYSNFNENCSHKYSKVGEYEVKLTVSNTTICFDDTVQVVDFVNTTVSPLNTDFKVSVYPIPASEQLIVKGINDVDIKVYTTTGQNIYAKHSLNETEYIDVSTFEKGIYLIHIISEDYSISKKIIIE